MTHAVSGPRGSRRRWLPALLPAACVAVLFLRTLAYEDIHYDDHDRLLTEPALQGLSWTNFKTIVSRDVGGRYAPLRSLSYAIDHELWGGRFWGYHLTQVLLHTLNVLLVHLLVREVLAGDLRHSRRLVGVVPAGGFSFRSLDSSADWGASLAAALFAVHPLVVEPVAWVHAREYLLAACFCLMSLYSYHLSGREGRTTGRRRLYRVGAGLSSVLACLSSVQAAALPLLLLAFERICGERDRPWRWAHFAAGTWPAWPAAVAALVVKFVSDAQAGDAGIRPAPEWLPWPQNLYTVLYTFWCNLRGIFWPGQLAPFYPNLVADRPAIRGVLGGLVGLSILLVLLWRLRRPSLRFAAWWLAIALLPVSMILPQHFYRADRYLYMPLMGVCLAVGSLAMLVGRHRPALPAVVVVGCGLVMIAGVRSWFQTPVWRNTVSVFEQSVRVNPADPMVHNNLGTALLRDNQAERAQRHFAKALRLQSRGTVSMAAQINFGYACLRIGDIDEAINRFTAALAINPNEARAYNGRGLAWARKQEPGHGRALGDFHRAIELNPAYFEAYLNRGNAYLDLGRFQEAVADYTRALEINRRYAPAYHRRAAALARQNRHAEALADLDQALSLGYDSPEVYLDRGAVRVALGAYREAVEDFTRVLELQPRHAEALLRRGSVYHLHLNQPDRALEDLNMAIEADPASAAAHLQRGLVWMTREEYDRAIGDLTQAIRLKVDDPQAYFQRGLAYAQRREIERARRDWQRAILLAPDSEAAGRARQNLAILLGPQTRPDTPSDTQAP